jgi:hypothetical protein
MEYTLKNIALSREHDTSYFPEAAVALLFQYRAVVRVKRTAPVISRVTSLNVPVLEVTRCWCPSSMTETPRVRSKARIRLALGLPG